MKNRIISIWLAIMLVLGASLIGCTGEELLEYNLTISSTEGGSVTTPGEGTFTYDEGKKVNLVAKPDEGYQFASWTGDGGTIANVNTASTIITMNDDYSITATFAVKQYSLVIHSMEGGSVTTPGEGAYTYDKDEVVNLVAVADESYEFINWTGDISTIVDVNAASTTITVSGGYSITANFARIIRDWYDLDAIRGNRDGSYILMYDLDSTTAGYMELAATTANGGKGWEPIGSLSVDPSTFYVINPVEPFTGSLDGQGYEIRDMFIGRPDEDGMGLFGSVGEGGVIENLGMMNVAVAGRSYVGGLVGCAFWGSTVRNSSSSGSVTGSGQVGGLAGGNFGTVSNSSSSSSVSGSEAQNVGGLVGCNLGTVGDSYSIGSVIGWRNVGGMVGGNWATVSNSWSGGGVTGNNFVGGLVGWNPQGSVSNSYSTGSVTGNWGVGGLVGEKHDCTVSNSYYSFDEVLINGRHIITIGALSDEDFEQWLANDKSLDVNEKLAHEDGYYLITNVSDFKELLAFGQDVSLKFRLESDLDLGNDPNFYIPYLAGEFDGNGHEIANLSFSFDFISQVGLFGYLASGGEVSEVGVENVAIMGIGSVGCLVGENNGTVSNSYSTGSVAGHWSVGGLVGWIGWHGGAVSNSHYSYDEVLLNGRHIITIGALSDEDFQQWLANDKFLDVDERLSQEDGYYLINDVGDFKQLLPFGQDDSLKFRLADDLDLGAEPNFYIPYLAGEFDGSGHKISNLRLNFDSIAQVGLFGYLGSDGKVSEVSAEDVDVIGNWGVGGLVGWSEGTVSNSYSTGSVTGYGNGVGALLGWNGGIVKNSYSVGSVVGYGFAGGLVGWIYDGGTVSNSYSTGRVTAGDPVGGLVGMDNGAVSNSFWDTETSGQTTSAGGTGRTTAQMKSVTIFSGVGWSIIAVANPDIRDTSHIWNIVDGQTYPFLSWQA